MRLLIFRVIAGSLLLSGLAAPIAFSQPPSTPAAAPTPATTSDPDAGFIAELKKQIAGKEEEPTETVFKNIQKLKGMPASRLLSAMKTVYSGSLGVRCEYCHDTQNWPGDDKTEKKIARQMIQMTRDINKLLRSVTGIKSERPMVNCTTCHRGQVKPALELEPTPASGN